jgi:hypothetical protein
MTAYSGVQSGGQPWWRDYVSPGPLWNNAGTDVQGRYIYIVQQLIADQDCVNWYASVTAQLGHPGDLASVFRRSGLNFYHKGQDVSLAQLPGINVDRFTYKNAHGQTILNTTDHPQIIINSYDPMLLNNVDLATYLVHEGIHAAGNDRGSESSLQADLDPEAADSLIKKNCSKKVR